MSYIYKSGKEYGLTNITINQSTPTRELTQAQYDALPISEKRNGTIYFIIDANSNKIIVDDPAPIGAILAYGGITAPDGWLMCDGSLISRTLYSELFAVIGTTYGAGDGSTTFKLPDLRGNVAIGASEDYDLGDSGGEEAHILTTNEMPSHSHELGIALNGVDANYRMGYNATNATTDGTSYPNYGRWRNATDYSQYYGVALTTGDSQSHNNMQPYIVTNYIIKAKDTSVVTGTRSGGGSVDSTPIPTATLVAEFDDNAHMNSEDMSSTEINSFLNGLGSVGSNYLQWQTYHPTLTPYNCSGTIGTNDIYLQYAATGNNVLVSFYGRAGIGSMTRTSSNPGFVFNLPFTPTSSVGSAIGGVVISGGTIRPECTMLHFLTDGTALFRSSETMINMANGNFMISGSGFFVIPIA